MAQDPLSQDELDLALDSIKRKIDNADPTRLEFQFSRLEMRVIGIGLDLVEKMVRGSR